MAPDFDHLCLMQKLEVFEYSLDNTTGQDFYRVLWLKSRNSEAWLDRRTNYCRTLAVMSMVGHILGLGDRHPSNLLMDRVSGRIVHVDFGDCFEVAMAREVRLPEFSRDVPFHRLTAPSLPSQKHPEKVPFRLTRMLTSAMEVRCCFFSSERGWLNDFCGTRFRESKARSGSLVNTRCASSARTRNRSSPCLRRLSTIRSSTGGSFKAVVKSRARRLEETTVREERGDLAETRPTSTTVCSSLRLEASLTLLIPRLTFLDEAVDQINARAVQVVERVQQKLTGSSSFHFALASAPLTPLAPRP
jgi:FKBP12-rapamycin complex-associated protein